MDLAIYQNQQDSVSSCLACKLLLHCNLYFSFYDGYEKCMQASKHACMHACLHVCLHVCADFLKYNLHNYYSSKDNSSDQFIKAWYSLLGYIEICFSSPSPWFSSTWLSISFLAIIINPTFLLLLKKSYWSGIKGNLGLSTIFINTSFESIINLTSASACMEIRIS